MYLRMFDAYAAAREAAAALLRRAGFSGADAVHVRACASGAPLSTAIPLMWGMDAEACLAAVCRAEKDRPETLFGAPLLRGAAVCGGHICFWLAGAAYDVLMERVIESCPLPGLPEEAAHLAYATARMLMLARRESGGCPENEAVRRALWLSMGVGEAAASPAERRARADRAASALLAMAHALPPRERMGLLAQCGGVGKCAARLLAYAAAEEAHPV